uniref:Centromere protein O n=1 Tax=Aplanochytrium stocchinoi TaxID=215587 RepID=A0A6S8DW37_9STRA|mmetsp:Transcript_6353/g.8340  ORF Transcript_6353/g.8340 Transcript_6353/m.8340 type:complete len:363 (-) Transcript_6353:1546-2634(-)
MEDKLSGNLAQGTLSHLSLLVEHSHSLKEAQSRAVTTIKRNRRLAELEQKLNSLKQKRQHLLNNKRKFCIHKDNEYRLTSLKSKLMDRFASQAYKKLKKVNVERVNEDDVKGNLMAIIAKKTSGSIRHRKLINIHNAYRLSGVSLFSIQETSTNSCAPDMLGVRWDASHRGSYMDRFYIIFRVVSKAQSSDGKLIGSNKNKEKQKTRDGMGKKFIIYRHSLPHFVPVKELWKESDFRTYVKLIGTYLNAFVARREQVAELSSKYACDELALRENINSNSSMTTSNVSASEAKDTILITGKFLKNIRSIRMSYASLVDVVPSRVTVKLKNPKEEMEVQLNKETTMQLTLLELIEECIELYNRT